MIRPTTRINASVEVPPSKSYTNRALIVSALADGASTLINPSPSEDSEYLIAALKEFGVGVKKENHRVHIQGTGGSLTVPSKEIFIGNAGTAMRFLSTFACLAQGDTTITGDERMQLRPINDLLDALRMSGIRCSSKNGCPPVTIHGGTFNGNRIDVHSTISSQFLSSLLLSAPYTKRPASIHVKGQLSSLPYINISLHVMRSFGAEIDFSDFSIFHVSNKERYIGREFHIESDASAATYFLAAAAITGGRIVVKKLSPESLQGDVKFIDVLSDMGCIVTKHEESLEVRGGKLRGIDVDMNHLPDCVPTLAVVAAFADGPTTISNIGQLQFKESNRLHAIATELMRIGAKVEVLDDGLVIIPQPLHGATIETYNDHRIAMSFAIAGLRVNAIGIKNPTCVSKSFPNFWEEFKKIEAKE
ncbi:MAG: 3-phosphoshikimate 1-carboxyvinyltransferase [Ignavibacteriae bacterium]|nr:3-phosphoshikimate 1-carboxyvinyltransferase [Ignavibacteria bacterium]MBI3364497.1 3-phosphoshikimate 1-carboxyvinyltransferase [Ignavibacteriota bacterium]